MGGVQTATSGYSEPAELLPAFTTPAHNTIEATALTPAEWDAMVPTRACVSVR